MQGGLFVAYIAYVPINNEFLWYSVFADVFTGFDNPVGVRIGLPFCHKKRKKRQNRYDGCHYFYNFIG